MATKHFSREEKLAVLASAKEIGIKEAAKVAEVHYTTVYEWRHQLAALGEKAFLAKKERTPGRGHKEIPEEKEKAILEMWGRHPGFGPGQVRNQLRRQGMTVSSRTVEKVMRANGYKGRGRRKEAMKESQRFEARRPLELGQIDILEFYINKVKVYLLLLVDDFSRFILGWRLETETSIDGVIAMVQQAIDRYGKMEEILSDRGFVFYSWRGGNRFERFLEVSGIHHTHARPHHPQTLGKVEAANKQVQKELIRVQHFDSVAEAQEGIANWVARYNYERTHQGLGGLLVPADRFHGRVEEVMRAISAHLDPDAGKVYTGINVARSIFNVVLRPSGEVEVSFLNQPIMIMSMKGDGKRTDS